MPEQREQIEAEKVKVKRIPTLQERFGIPEGQLVIFEFAGDSLKYVVSEMYDHMMIIRNNKRTIQIQAHKIEELVNSGALQLLSKNGEPVLGKRRYVLFGDWVV